MCLLSGKKNDYNKLSEEKYKFFLKGNWFIWMVTG